MNKIKDLISSLPSIKQHVYYFFLNWTDSGTED